MLDGSFEESDVKLQSRYNVLFRTKSLVKGMKLLVCYGHILSPMFFYKDSFGIK